MGTSNKVFVSPGVYTSERDLTFITRQVGVTTLGLVGETTKGPAFQPIFVTNYDEFKSFFGGLNPTKFKDTGNPKYELPYIAKSFLSQSNQLFVSRVLGLSGYEAGRAWGITLDAAMDTTTSGSTVGGASRNPLITFTASTAGTVTITSTDSMVTSVYNAGLITGDLSFLLVAGTGATATVTPKFIKNSESGSAFSGVSFNLFVKSTASIGGGLTTGTTSGVTSYYSGTSFSDVENKIVAVLRSRAAYDGSENLIFQVSANTQINFSQTATTVQSSVLAAFNLTGTSNTTGAFNYSVSLDSTNKNYITRVLGVTSQDAKTAVFVEDIYTNMLSELIADNKVRGVNLNLINYGTTFHDNVTEYKPAVSPYVVSELRGTEILQLFRFWTISDGDSANREIKISIANIKPDEKTFDVYVRSFYDTDANPTYLEKYAGLTMDPTSNNYIGRRIGTLDGQFGSNSNYILVDFDTTSDTSDTFPSGFLGFTVRDADANGNTGVQNPTINYNTEYTAFQKKRKFFLGLSDTTGIDSDFFDYKGVDSTGAEWSATTKGFHMDSGATSSIIGGTVRTFDVGNAEFRTNAGLVGTDYAEISARKFTMAVAGGFDGWDIYRISRTNTDTYAISGTKGIQGQSSGAFATKLLSTGENGISSDFYAYFEGMRTFSNPEAVNINVFATPGIDNINNTILIQDSIDMIETERGDSLYIITTPDVDASGISLDPADVADTISGEFDSSYTATYWPWIQINDAENNQYVYVPATRDVVRNIAITDNTSFPWFASAGVSRGQVDCIKARVKLTESQRDTLYENRINPIATFSSEGVVIWGNKTLQVAETALNRINVRRLLLQTRKLISAVSIRLLFEQNDDVVRNQFLSQVNPILDNIRKERGLTDFRVVLDNSPESIDRNELNGQIFIKPSRSLEFISIAFVLTPTGASFDSI